MSSLYFVWASGVGPHYLTDPLLDPSIPRSGVRVLVELENILIHCGHSISISMGAGALRCGQRPFPSRCTYLADLQCTAGFVLLAAASCAQEVRDDPPPARRHVRPLADPLKGHCARDLHLHGRTTTINLTGAEGRPYAVLTVGCPFVHPRQQNGVAPSQPDFAIAFPFPVPLEHSHRAASYELAGTNLNWYATGVGSLRCPRDGGTKSMWARPYPHIQHWRTSGDAVEISIVSFGRTPRRTMHAFAEEVTDATSARGAVAEGRLLATLDEEDGELLARPVPDNGNLEDADRVRHAVTLLLLRRLQMECHGIG